MRVHCLNHFDTRLIIVYSNKIALDVLDSGFVSVPCQNAFLAYSFLGHETTSGMLTFAVYHLLKNPSTLIKLRQEVDDVIGTGNILLEHLDKMPYLNGSPLCSISGCALLMLAPNLLAVMRETLRLSPTIPARNTSPLEDTEIIGGDGDPSNPTNKKYAIKKNAPMVVHAHMTQIDPRCWGEDAQLFRPERMLDGKFEAAPVSYCAFLLTS